MRINLMGKKRRRFEVYWNEVAAVLAVVLVLFFSFAYYGYYRAHVSQWERQLEIEQEHLEALREREASYHALRREIESWVMPEDYRLRQPKLSESLKELSENMPFALSLDQLRVDQGALLMRGYTVDLWPLLSLMLNLQESDYYEQVSVDHFQRGDDTIVFQIRSYLPRRGE